MSKAERINAAYQKAKADRQMVESLWRECFRFTYPLRGSQFRTSSYDGGSNVVDAAGTLAGSIFDATATDAVRGLASGLFGGMMPANAQWIDLTADEPDEWLDDAAKTTWQEIHASNFDQDGFDAVLDGIIAMGYLFIDDVGGDLHFESWSTYTVMASASRAGGAIDIIYREFALTSVQAFEAYGDACSADIRAAVQSSPNKQWRFMQAIYPNPDYVVGSKFGKQLAYASCHLDLSNMSIVRERGYHEFPVAVFRWDRIPGSAYAVGPVFSAMPSIRSLNESMSLMLDNAEIAVKGMWKAKDDGVINPATIQLGGGRVVTVSDMNNFDALNPPGDINIAMAEIELLRADVRRVLMADYLVPPQANMTKAEFLERLEIIRQMLGPAYGRVNEFLQTIVTRCLGILIRAGRIDQPPAYLSQGRGVSIRFTSPVARAQRMQEVNSIIQYEANIGQLMAINPDIGDNYDWDAATIEKAHLMGVPQKLIRNKAAIAKIRGGRQQQQQQAIEQQQQQQMDLAVAPKLAGVR